MERIIILNEELEAQMRLYLALCEDYRVEIAEDEPTLMRMIRRKKPELIFLDADYSGYSASGKSVDKTIQRLKKKYEALKIITVFGEMGGEDAERAYSTGSDDVLHYPLKEDVVLERVATQFQPRAQDVN